LNGFTIVNIKRTGKHGLHWKAILFELLNTTNQGGEIGNSLLTGAENYYINHQYPEGWTYLRTNLGSPFISSRTYVRENLSSSSTNYFVNNRVRLFHVGVEASLNDLFITTKISYSRNYGSSQPGGTQSQAGGTNIQASVNQTEFKAQNQLSAYLRCQKSFKGNVSAGLMVAIDNGALFYNSHGFQAHFAKTF